MTDYRRFNGLALRRAREKRGLTLKDVVKRSNHKFTQGALSSWERGAYLPTQDNVELLLATLLCDWEDISEPVPVRALQEKLYEKE